MVAALGKTNLNSEFKILPPTCFEMHQIKINLKCATNGLCSLYLHKQSAYTRCTLCPQHICSKLWLQRQKQLQIHQEMKHPNMLIPSPAICITNDGGVHNTYVLKPVFTKTKTVTNNWWCLQHMLLVKVTKTKTNTSRNEMVDMKTKKKIVVITTIFFFCFLYKYKTLPKEQRSSGLSSAYRSNFFRSYYKFKHNSWSNFIFRTPTKHKLQKVDQTSASWLNLKFKILTKLSFRDTTKIQHHNLYKTSAEKYWPHSSLKLLPELQLQNLDQALC